MVTLKVESKRVHYDIVLENRVTILTGDSASGKTYLVDKILEIAKGRNKKDGLIYNLTTDKGSIFTSIPIVLPLGLDYLKKIVTKNCEKDILCIVDEEFKGISSKNFADFVNKTPRLYLLVISREFTNHNLIYSVAGIHKMQSLNKEGVTVNSNTPILSNKVICAKLDEHINVNFGNTIFIEDSAEGKLLLELFISDEVDIVSTYGKDGVPKTIDKSGIDKNTLIPIVVDMYAYGSNYFQHLKELNSTGYVPIYFIDYKSFEYLLLKTFLNGNFTEYIEYIKNSDMVSEEHYYELVLSNYINAKLGVPYVKGATPSVVIDKRIPESLINTFKSIPRKWVIKFSELFLKLQTFSKSSELTAYLFNIVLNSNKDDVSFIALELLLCLYVGNIGRFCSTRVPRVINNSEFTMFMSNLQEFGVEYKLFIDKNGIELVKFKYK